VEVDLRLSRALGHTPRRPCRRGQRGQGFVEFSLVLPVFLISLFSLINAGFLLYSINAVDQSATVGANYIAAAGNAPTADINGVTRMVSAGLGTTALISVTEIDVELLVNGNNGGFATNSDGSPKVSNTCGSGSSACIDKYTFTVSGGTTTVNVLPPLSSPCSSASQCPIWMPENRIVKANTTDPDGAGPSFVGLVIKYHYSFMGAPAGGLDFVSTKTFRLEPQS
jgi:Flp pilus assembly protein TadG